MVSTYLALLTMLIIALGLLSLAYGVSLSVSLGKFVITSLFMIFFSCILYFYSGDKIALNNWLQHGKEHYVLMQQFQNLGGVQGMIVRVKQRLSENPHDTQGWLILGRLYEANLDNANAKLAFAKAAEGTN